MTIYIPKTSALLATLSLLAISAAAQAQEKAALLTPLAPEARKALEAVRSDPPPKNLIYNRHYSTSNELRQYLYRDKIKPLGGMYIGVGSEQNYVLSGWARPELMVLFDFDQWVVDLHAIYGAMFLAARTPAALVELWNPRNHKQLEALIRASPRTRERVDRLMKIYQATRRMIYKHLRWIRQEYKSKRVPTFLSDQQQYDHIVALYRNNRVHAVRGDFTGELTMKDLAAFGKRFKIPVRMLYLSNVEFYFDYDKGRYRDNILDLAFGASSLVLHTVVLTNSRYRYVYQAGANFQRWLACRCVPRIKVLTYYGRMEGKDMMGIHKDPRDFPALLRRIKRAARKGTVSK